MQDVADLVAAYLHYSGPCRLWVLVAELRWPEKEILAVLSNRKRFHWGDDVYGPLVGLRRPPWFTKHED